jgi:hypothetical protein
MQNWFSFLFFLASTPPLSAVSLCFALQPWWKMENWLFALFISFVSWFITFDVSLSILPDTSGARKIGNRRL